MARRGGRWGGGCGKLGLRIGKLDTMLRVSVRAYVVGKDNVGVGVTGTELLIFELWLCAMDVHSIEASAPILMEVFIVMNVLLILRGLDCSESAD